MNVIWSHFLFCTPQKTASLHVPKSGGSEAWKPWSLKSGGGVEPRALQKFRPMVTVSKHTWCKGASKLHVTTQLKARVMGSNAISWTICKSFAPRSRQITMSVPHHSDFTGRMPFLPSNQQRQSTVLRGMRIEEFPIKNVVSRSQEGRGGVKASITLQRQARIGIFKPDDPRTRYPKYWFLVLRLTMQYAMSYANYNTKHGTKHT